MEIPKNLVQSFVDFANLHPKKIALVEPVLAGEISFEALEPMLDLAPSARGTSAVEDYQERSWTFAEIQRLMIAYQLRLRNVNLRKGDRVVLMIPISVRMYALAAACFAEGVVPVFIEPSMKRKNFLKSLAKVKPKAIFSVDRFFRYLWILPVLEPRLFLPFLKIKFFTFEQSRFLVRSWAQVEVGADSKTGEIELAEMHPRAEALITFTTGTTGHPKAADRCLEVLFFQREISRTIWTEAQADIEMSAFPLVVLNNLVHGVTTVLPMMNGPKVTDVSIESVARQIERHGVKRLIAPPSFLNKIFVEGRAYRDRFRSLECVLTGGAPTPHWLMRDTLIFFEWAKCFLVYGSTEAEPISHIRFDQVLNVSGRGYLVGTPIPEISVRIVSAGELPDSVVPPCKIGEILLSGPHVVRRYLFNDLENQTSKPVDRLGQIWHRTGDTGYLDGDGRLWICGRIKDRVKYLNTQLETYAVEHELENAIGSRVALVAPEREDEKISVFAERSDNLLVQAERHQKLLSMLAESFGEEFLAESSIRFLAKLPVDTRHQWKIDRKALQDQVID